MEVKEIPAPEARKEKHPARERQADRAERKSAKPVSPGRVVRGKGGEMVKLYVGAGRKLKVRPGVIVGAIAGEMGIEGQSIGTITVFDRHSIVAVPADLADEIVAALSVSSIKGKKILVRRDRAG